MRCLYIAANQPISPNFTGGGSAVYYEQLMSLIGIGIDVHLWHFRYENRSKEFEECIAADAETWNQINEVCEKVYLNKFSDTPSLTERISNKIANKLTGNEVRNPLLRGRCYPVLKSLISEIKPDFIWSQHLAPTQTSLLQKSVPVIYSHHDWIYKVKSVDHKNGPDLTQKNIEERLTVSSAAVVSGSIVECDQLKKIGCRNVHYIPVAYKKADFPSGRQNGHPTIVHLGGLGTTANRIGLERFFEVVWTRLNLDSSQMRVIGDMSLANDKMKNYLAEVTTTGFVSDLNQVMKSYDIHVIPWEYETGQRTRLISAFNYGQAVVATRKSVACFPEIVDGENCLLADNLEEMPHLIDSLLNNFDLRKKIGDNARETFEKHFTREALVPKYKSLIESLNLNGSNSF